jgi:hypothetical protein
MQSKLVWISDPGHAWLRVPIGDYFASGIQASRYSYVDTAYVYLEEDCDAELYLDAAQIPEPYAWREIYFADVGARGNPRHLDRISSESTGSLTREVPRDDRPECEGEFFGDKGWR